MWYCICHYSFRAIYDTPCDSGVIFFGAGGLYIALMPFLTASLAEAVSWLAAFAIRATFFMQTKSRQRCSGFDLCFFTGKTGHNANTYRLKMLSSAIFCKY
jgi:hypothetical protein